MKANPGTRPETRRYPRTLLAALLPLPGLLSGCGGGGSDADEPVQITFTVSVSVSGNGIVRSVSGIDCGSICSSNIPVNTDITLTAVPAAGHVLQGWGGACAGASGSTCVLPVTRSVQVSASFAAAGGP